MPRTLPAAAALPALLGDVRRRVLRRRRLLSAVLAGVAVLAGARAVAPPPPPTVAVVVAAHDLAAGDVLAADDLTEVTFARGTVPGGLARRPSGRVVAAPVTRGQPLTEVALVGPSMTGARDDLRAVPVRLPDAGAVVLLRVGDRVDLLATDPQSGATTTVVRAATVLTVPRADEATGPTGLPGRLVVLGVADDELDEVVQATTRAVVTYTWSSR